MKRIEHRALWGTGQGWLAEETDPLRPSLIDQQDVNQSLGGQSF